jgi:hypothetical protein
MKKSFVACSFFLFGIVVVYGQQCQFKDSKGNIYNFNILKNNEDYYIPRNTYPNQPWDIWINVCKALTSQKCGPDCACCQEWDSRSPSGHASLGKYSTGSVMDAKKPGAGGYGLSIEFVNGDDNRKMELDFTCDPSAGFGKPVYTNEAPILHYNFQWASQYGCPTNQPLPPSPGPGPSPDGPSEGLGADSIILILLFVAIFVYIVGGILFKKYRMGATGWDMIPNLGFWTALPGLVKDGIVFTYRSIRERISGGGYSQV